MIAIRPTRKSVVPLCTAYLLLAILANGCSGKKDGPERYNVSGEVTFQGKPVPKGFINFRPDDSKQNTGPGSGAAIVDGKYELEDGKGVVGGAYIVEITGSDGVPYTESGEEVTDGKELFPKYTTTFNFPKEDTKQNFDVPPASKRKKKKRRRRESDGCE